MKSVLDEMTDEQRKILKQFREDLASGDLDHKDLNSFHSDELLVKYLRAENFNLRKAKKIFFVHYYNKIITRMNNVLNTYKKPETAKKYEATAVLGYAKDGSLIRYTAAGRLDFYGFIMSMSCFELCAYFSHMMESDIKTLKDESLRTGKHVSEVTYIVDLEDFSMQKVLHKCVIEMGLDFMRLVQECYPEMWRYVLVVNVPKIFYHAFEIFKSVMRSTVLEKIRFAEKDKTKDLLLKYVDENVLPAFLGGKKVDSNGDPMCKEFIMFGGYVPKSFYSQNLRIPISTDDPEVRFFNIGARSTFNLSLAVREPGSIFHAQARTEGASLYISCWYKKFGPNPDDTEIPGENEYLDEKSENFEYTQVSVEIRGQFHCTQEDMCLLFPWPGIYVIRCSNANSWFTSRKAYIKYQLIPPSK